MKTLSPHELPILIVEDESIVALDIARQLQSMGYTVCGIAEDAASTFALAQEEQPKLVLMDVHIKGEKDGIEVAQILQKDQGTAVIYITAYEDHETVRRAVATNPHGYLLKPIRPSELDVTLKLAFERIRNSAEHGLPDGAMIPLCAPYLWDQEFLRLYKGREPMRLGKLETQLLALLASARGGIVPTGTIEHELWPEAPAAESTLRTLIYRLKKKLDGHCIQTIPGVGVRLKVGGGDFTDNCEQGEG